MRPANSAARQEVRSRILVVDDSADNTEVIVSRLSQLGYDVDSSSHGEAALQHVRRAPPDLILLDVMLPGLDGYEVARRIKTDDTLPFIPIILVTARDSTRDKVAGFDAGADDYLTKPLNFPELEARVRSMLRIKRLQDQLEEKNRELERLSVSDGLTGLFNYRHLHEVLQEEFDRSRRTARPLAVAMFDLDHFKRVNDTYGHQAGDEVLSALATILRESAREIDKLGRYGGEEFVAILPESDLAAAHSFAERVRRTVAAHTFRVAPDTAIRLTLSAGVASSAHGPETTARLLLERADEALYAAKRQGRNRVVREDTAEAAALRAGRSRPATA